MSAMLARGCGISDTLASLAQATDTPLDRLRRAQRLEALLAQLGPRARDAGGAGKSPRTMRRTGAFITQLISSLYGEVCAAAQYLPAAAGIAVETPYPARVRRHNRSVSAYRTSGQVSGYALPR